MRAVKQSVSIHSGRPWHWWRQLDQLLYCCMYAYSVDPSSHWEIRSTHVSDDILNITSLRNPLLPICYTVILVVVKELKKICQGTMPAPSGPRSIALFMGKFPKFAIFDLRPQITVSNFLLLQQRANLDSACGFTLPPLSRDKFPTFGHRFTFSS